MKPPSWTISTPQLMAATKEQDRFDRSVGVAKLARRAGIERKRLWRALNRERAMGPEEFVRLRGGWG